MKLKNEIERREKKEDDEASILGTEIKNRRLSLSLTLAALAEDTCSTSYLCKIEKAQINPNDKRLEEICKRVGMSKTQYNDLLQLKKALGLVCDYYFNDNKNGIEKLKKSVIDFSNYRSNIINYVIALFENDTFKLNRYSKLIINLIKEITDLDLLVFMTFYSIDLMKQRRYVEAADNIKAIIDKKSGMLSLHILQMECLFECAYRSGSPYLFKYYEQLKLIYFDNMLYERSQKLHYKMATYELINQRVEGFEYYFTKINDTSYRYKLDFLKSIICGNYEKAKKAKVDKLSYELEMLYYYYFNSDMFRSKYKINEVQKIEFRPKLFIEYLNAKSKNNRLDFLQNEGIPSAIKGCDGFLLDYFLQALSNILQRQGGYLSFMETYIKVIDCKRMINQI